VALRRNRSCDRTWEGGSLLRVPGRGSPRSLDCWGQAMALRNDGIRPDASELRIRFVCGAILGSFLGAGCAFQLGAGSPTVHGLVFAVIVGGVIAGALARHFGDRFWFSLRRWLG